MQKYSINIDPDKTAKAFGYELHCSPKDSMNLAYAIKGMKTADAEKYHIKKLLDLAVILKKQLNIC